jgi:hypothetical protein
VRDARSTDEGEDKLDGRRTDSRELWLPVFTGELKRPNRRTEGRTRPPIFRVPSILTSFRNRTTKKNPSLDRGCHLLKACCCLLDHFQQQPDNCGDSILFCPPTHPGGLKVYGIRIWYDQYRFGFVSCWRTRDFAVMTPL